MIALYRLARRGGVALSNRGQRAAEPLSGAPSLKYLRWFKRPAPVCVRVSTAVLQSTAAAPVPRPTVLAANLYRRWLMSDESELSESTSTSSSTLPCY